MRRRLTSAALVCLIVLAGTLAPGSLYAFKTTSTTSPGSAPGASLTTAQLLASHGEPRLALESLRAAGLPADDAAYRILGVRLLTESGRPLAAESLLVSGLPARASRRDDFLVHLQGARLLLDAGRPEAALHRIVAIDTMDDPLYGAYRDYVASRAHLARGRPEPAARALERAFAAAPEALRPAIDESRVEVYRALGRTADAFAAARDASEIVRDAGERRRWLRVRFELAMELDRPAEAAAAARILFDDHRRSTEAGACAAALVAAGAVRAQGDDFLFACASTLQARGRADALRAVLRILDERTLDARAAEEHRLLWGEYHFLGGDFSRAIALARPTYADPGLRRRSMLLMARSYKRVGRSADAAVTYEGFAVAFPNDAIAAEALFTAASLYGDLGREADRTRVLDDLRHAYPSTFHGWAASMERAKSAAAEGRRDDASSIFEQWLTRSRRTDEAALFYYSQLQNAGGNPEAGELLLGELRRVNPYSFYVEPDVAALPAGFGGDGRLASWLADADARRDDAYRRVMDTARRGEGGTVATPASKELREALERGRFFLAAGFRDWAEAELDVARSAGATSASDGLAMARLYDEHAMPWRSVRLYERARAAIPWSERRLLDDDFRYLTHPVPYPAQVLAASARESIAPHLLYGMMREESRFEAEVVSRAGAVGLMQLMPATARQVAKKMDRTLVVDDRLGEPEVNVSLGAWYAADLLRAGEGSSAWMLAAYNAGPGAARRWIRPGAAGDAAIDAVESIGYKETRGYVKRVTESANVYHSLYFGTGGKASSTPR